MLNIDQIRRAPGEVAAALARRGEDTDFAALLRLDEERRAAVTERDNLRATHNQLSREFGQLMAASRSGGGESGTAGGAAGGDAVGQRPG